MNSILKTVAPSATNMIRADHSRVMSTFHHYEIDCSPQMKHALVASICLALEIHAQIEEEIFYPAMRSADSQIVEKNVHDHDEMRRLIAILRGMDSSTPEYDTTLMSLMRDVMRHVADEETTLLPDAERQLGADRLCELGAEMAKRRLQRAAPHAGEMAMHTMRTMPASTMLLAAGAVLGGTFLVTQAMKRQSSLTR